MTMMGDEFPDHAVDIGGGHRITFYAESEGDRRVGLIDWHRRSDGSICAGSVPFRVDGYDHGTRTLPDGTVQPKPTWEVVSWDPLTLTPSVLCTPRPDGAEPSAKWGCGAHGFITDGRWVNA